MLRDFVLELVSAPGNGPTITLPGVAPTGRVTWASGFGASQPYVFYVLDNSLQQEWGIGPLTVGAPSTITRPTVVLGNSQGTTARLNFTSTCRCYSGLPAVAALAAMGAPIGRNRLHNALFAVQQRGVGPVTASSQFDRWLVTAVYDTLSAQIYALGDPDRAAIGDEEAQFGFTVNFGGVLTGAAASYLCQRIENVPRLSGKTVTVSFWASANTAGLKLAVSLDQNFGTGGSPSAPVQGAGTVVTLGTAWARYSVTLTLPSIAGKTFGTAGNNYTQLNFWYSSGGTNATRAGGIGIQSGIISFWGMQLEVGVVATPLEKLDFRNDLSNCQRFFQSYPATLISGYGNAGGGIYEDLTHAVPMRATPSVSFANVTYNNASAVAVNGVATSHVRVQITVTATGAAYGVADISLAADL